jgi:hypothetical protein
MSIHQKLNAARNEFHTLTLKKSGLNKFAGYDYFELADFLVPALRVLSNHDLCAYISFGSELATMRIVDVTDGAAIEITSPMAEAALKGCHPIQNLGAVQSYLRRYLWVAALEIVEHDALDSSEGLKDEKKAAAKKMPTKEFVDHCTAISDAVDLGEDALKEAFAKAWKAAEGYGDNEAQESLKLKYDQAKELLKGGK